MFRHLLALSCLSFFLSVQGADLTINETSVFAVITHKGGIAKGLAHNHFVYATNFESHLAYDEAATVPLELDLDFAVEGLKIDDFEGSSKWFPRLKALGLVEEPFSEQSDKNQQKVRKSMLSRSQLDIESHPRLGARLESIRERASEVNGQAFSHEMQVQVTIRGKTVAVAFKARLEHDGENLQLEAVGTLKFSDFGIKPYSAMLGAVSIEDGFYIYVNLEAS